MGKNAQSITEIYQALRPLWLRDLAQAISGVGAGAGSGTTSGMVAHALASSWHTGQLAETQAPWAATKNEWATALATHAALPDVHHAAVSAGTGISVAGQQISLSSTVAGAGLGYAAGVLSVGVSGLGLSVAADAVALASSSNPGAAASILASSASGGLTLASLGVIGAMTVGQDFTVGANVLYVNQAGTRVGINRAPDQQFDLDVAGAIRGQYLIGRHAIQLSSAVGVWHYDGPAPYNLDFGGSDASHAGVGGTVAGGVIYRPGKFGKAVQVAPATTNLLVNPSFEINTTEWATDYPAATTLTRTAGALYGDYYLAVTATGTGNFYSPAVTVTNSTAYAVSFWYRTPSAIMVHAHEYGNSTNYGTATLPTATTWTRYTILMTTPASSSTMIRLIFSNLGAGESIDIDGVQVEQKNYASPYCDGSLGTGHSWSGMAHASTSSRTGATLQYANAGGLSVQAGTIQMWVWLDSYNASGGGLFGSGANAEFDAYISSSGDVVFRTDGNSRSTGTVALGSWTHLTFTWDAAANSKKIYLNGVESTSTTYAATATLGSTLYVGSIAVGGNGLALNGLIDEFVLTDYAMDAKLIRAIYESDAPVFVESSVFHWRSPSASPIWADEYGLWARSVTGNEILGVYGGDPRRVATYRSWGGVNLDDNDVLIGRAAGGYMHWDDSAQTLNVQGTITALAGSIAGVLTIGSSGEIRQGTGTLGTDYTGLRMWRDSGIGRIGGYANNTLQWYAGTDGRLYAGGGVVSLNQYGYMIATADFSSGGTWPFVFAGLHAVADVASPTANYRGSLMFGQPIGVYAEIPLVWHFHYPGALPQNTPTGGGASRNTAIMISDDNESWTVWHTGNDSDLAKLAGATFTGALRVSGDGGGATSSIGFSNVSNTSANSTGVGTVLMKGATSRNSAGFIKIYIGTTAYYVPVFSAITG